FTPPSHSPVASTRPPPLRNGGEQRAATRSRRDDRRAVGRAGIIQSGAGSGAGLRPGRGRSAVSRRRARSWPDLLRHTSAVAALPCPRWGGRMRVVAPIEAPVVIRKILTPLGLPTAVPHLIHRRPTCSTGADLVRRRCLSRPLAPTVRPPAASGAYSR